MMRHDRKKHGVAVSGSWLPVGLNFLKSRACAELSPHAAKLLIDLMSTLGPNATGNGDLSIAPKSLRVRGWTSRATLAAATKELMDAGLLVLTRQGSRTSCSLFAVAIYPLNCDIEKLDIRPGAYLTTDFAQNGKGEAPTEEAPANWKAARKTKRLSPPRNKLEENCSVAEQDGEKISNKAATLFRHGTIPPDFGGVAVPPRVTFIELPSVSTNSAANARQVKRQTGMRRPVHSPLCASWALHHERLAPLRLVA